MNIPIVTLDKIYLEQDENTYFLDCTRIEGKGITSRMGTSIDKQIYDIATQVGDKIILVDDVVFSGNVLKDIIERFRQFNVEVVKIVSCISTIDGYNYFNKSLRYGLDTLYLLSSVVLDQICERDFYFGIAGSGVLVEKNNVFYKAPYFKPFGNPCLRASIPEEFENYFSVSCIDRSLYLWQSIEQLKNGKVLMNELPEKIINTNSDDEVVKVLKKGRYL